ncbi:class I SAM-dependent methyltransferase [Galactobacter caseinivorans]|nr:class I SAM-dependent methyltransferase [Galactobacter caseinivorans]
MRRVDRWMSGTRAGLLRHGEPLVVDLGFGASPSTTVEMFTRLRSLNPALRVHGLEIEPERVERARAAQRDGLSFGLGGFELDVSPAPTAVRLFNVLRQYREEDVEQIWSLLTSRLAPGGFVVEGTCDELGRRATWVTLERGGPVALTLSTHLATLGAPSDLAERLPKALIHRNVPGERIHAFFQAADAAWAQSTAVAPFGLRQRWRFMAARLKEGGWNLLDDAHRWRLGEVTVAWGDVAPGR